MNYKRQSGIMLHPTSLPSPHGIGDLGQNAYKFIDFLTETRQGIWQILPLGHTSFGDSPYMCFSAFSGNPLLVSPDKLYEDGLLEKSDLQSVPKFSADRVDYGAVIPFKYELLIKAFKKFKSKKNKASWEAFYAFNENHAFWLEDYALFAAIKNAHGGKPWIDWDAAIANRQGDAIVEWHNRLADDVLFWKFVQFKFFEQWYALRDYCHENDITIIGDIPIYVAYDSADVWANRELFHLDDKGRPTIVAGVPPDYFSATGQRWGNPIYRWGKMQERGFDWWIHRFRMNLDIVDMVRLDHFRGFEAYWEIPAGEETAVQGRWVKGPDIKLFEAVNAALGEVNLIAEDLGVITPEVDELRDRLGLPGMRILQVAFGSDSKSSEYRPHNYIQNCAVYTASHDHNTTVGWFTAEPGKQTTQSRKEVEAERKHALKYLDSDGSEIHWDFIRLALGSVARMAVFPLQDVLGLGAEARMNMPGSAQGNWAWRFKFADLKATIRKRLRELTELYERNQPEE